jgi:hypothetical protein
LDGTGDLALLKKAGDVIHDKAEKCRLYEVGATVGYYGGCLRARLTSDPLSTILAHARMQGSGFKGVTYLSVETRHLTTYHPTVAALLDPVQSPFAVVVDMTDGRNRVLVYRIDLMAGGKWHAEPGGILPRTIEASRLQQ